MLSYQRQQPASRQGLHPDWDAILESGFVKRCGVCLRLWDAGQFTIEEGAIGTEERCPSCVDGRTAIENADTLIEETEFAASREPVPQVSVAALNITFPGTITSITDSGSVRVYESAPLSLVKTVATTLLLVGRDFSSTDTITGATGLTIAVSSRTAALTTLSITAAGSMTAGNYGITFNDVDFNNILSVR